MRPGNIVRFGLLALLWGSNFLLIKIALDGLSPLQIVAVRMMLGAAVLLAVVGGVGQRRRLPRAWPVWGHLAVAAIIANIIPYFLFAWAEQRIPSNVAGVLNATTPLFTLGLALAVREEQKATPNRVLGLVLGFTGVLVILAPWRDAGLAQSLAGQLACLAASASYAVSYVYTKRYLAGRGLSPLILAAGQLTAASVLLAVTAPLLATTPVTLTPAVLASILTLGAAGTGIAYILNYHLIQDEGSTTASTVTYLLPVVAVVLGVLALDEPITWTLLTGTAIVLAGVALSEGRLSTQPTRVIPVPEHPHD